MFIELPVTFYGEENETTLEDVDVNPLHIVSIKADPEDSTFCIAVDITGDIWYIRMSRQQLKKKIQHFIETNILHHYYNSLKNNNG